MTLETILDEALDGIRGLSETAKDGHADSRQLALLAHELYHRISRARALALTPLPIPEPEVLRRFSGRCPICQDWVEQEERSDSSIRCVECGAMDVATQEA